MKNPHIERRKQGAKLFHRNNTQTQYEDGVIVRHVYSPDNPERLTWWDDTGFILNDYRVLVAWTHPRNAYKDAVDHLAHDEVEHLYKRSGDMFEKSKANYAKVGKSRKKVTSWTSSGFGARHQEWYAALNEAQARILLDNDIVIVPRMTVEWAKTCRFVTLCVPLEVRGVADLKTVCDLTKRLLKRETTLSEVFLNYTYTVDNWKAETGNATNVGLNSHLIA